MKHILSILFFLCYILLVIEIFTYELTISKYIGLIGSITILYWSVAITICESFEKKNNIVYINDLAEICHTSYNQFMINDLKRVRVGSCFQTKDDAINARDKMAKVLLNK